MPQQPRAKLFMADGAMVRTGALSGLPPACWMPNTALVGPPCGEEGCGEGNSRLRCEYLLPNIWAYLTNVNAAVVPLTLLTCRQQGTSPPLPRSVITRPHCVPHCRFSVVTLDDFISTERERLVVVIFVCQSAGPDEISLYFAFCTPMPFIAMKFSCLI